MQARIDQAIEYELEAGGLVQGGGSGCALRAAPSSQKQGRHRASCGNNGLKTSRKGTAD